MAAFPSARRYYATALALWVGAALVAALFRPALLPPFEKPVMEEFAVQDLLTVLSGSRRLGADIAFVQMIQYFGTGDYADPKAPFGKFKRLARKPKPPVSSARPELDGEEYRDWWPLMDILTLRTGALDPYFHHAYLFGAGALGFTLYRYDDALAVLTDAARKDPTYWRYRLYAGAMAYKRGDEMNKAIPLLEEAVRHPDCPTMIKNILGNMYRKVGDTARAIDIFMDIVRTSRDADYVELAVRRLAEMGVVLPE